MPHHATRRRTVVHGMLIAVLGALGALGAVGALGACGGSPGPAADAAGDGAISGDASVLSAVDFDLDLEQGMTEHAISRALLGHYDLSGALYAYAERPGLVAAMQEAGFTEWRVSVGRWEATTWLLPQLTDGTPCAFPLPGAFAPAGWSDLDLLGVRDWFTDDGAAVTLADLEDDARYALDYVHQVLDTVEAFGAEPFVSLDHLPRALAANRTLNRSAGTTPDICLWTFANQVSNGPPADPQLYASALAGLVRRLLEGSGGHPARAVRYFEVGNEPELCPFWDPFPNNGLDCQAEAPGDRLGPFFDMAVPALLALAAYRDGATHPNAAALRFGLGSFASGDVAAVVLEQFDAAPVAIPVDFLSFHAYDTDPRGILRIIAQVAAAREATTRYQDVELVLAEWGPTLEAAIDPTTLDQPLLMSTVLLLGAALGLDRAHHSIFWDFHPEDAIVWGLLDHDGQPRPLHRAYVLLDRLLAPGAIRLALPAAPGGRLSPEAAAPGDLNAVAVTRDGAGRVRMLAVNHEDRPRTLRLRRGGVPALPSAVLTFASPESGIVPGASTDGEITLPGRSLTFAEY